MSKYPRAAIALALLSVIIAYGIAEFVFALPTGATVTNISTAGSPTTIPGNRTDARGTITTITLDSIQQDQYWKAYVGNITGRLSLDNAAGFTIYDWALSSVNKTGKVYVTRNSAIDFTNVTCANQANISSEHVFFNMTGAQSDNIKNTFNYSSHEAFFVGTTPFVANACNSTATYVSDVRQTMDGTQKFQELLLQDSGDNIIYTTILSQNVGYDNETYDFQIIVPESGISATPTTYYFFTELNG